MKSPHISTTITNYKSPQWYDNLPNSSPSCYFRSHHHFILTEIHFIVSIDVLRNEVKGGINLKENIIKNLIKYRKSLQFQYGSQPAWTSLPLCRFASVDALVYYSSRFDYCKKKRKIIRLLKEKKNDLVIKSLSLVLSRITFTPSRDQIIHRYGSKKFNDDLTQFLKSNTVTLINRCTINTATIENK